jgi:hypothetical protein
MGTIPKDHISPTPEQATALKEAAKSGSLSDGGKKVRDSIAEQQAKRASLGKGDFAVVAVPKTLEERISRLATTVRQAGMTQTASAEIVEVLGLLLREVRQLQGHLPPQ